MAYADSLRQQYATFTNAADLIDGVLSASTIFSAFSLGSTTAAAYFSQYGANANAAAIYLQKSRNATVGSQTIVNAADEIGRINFAPSNGSGFQTSAAIIAFVDGTPSGSGDLPTGLVFQTTPDGSGTIAERMRIDDAGNVGIGRTNPGNYGNFEVGGTAYAATGILSSSASGSILILAANSTSETRINTNSNHPMVLYTNNTERARFHAAGGMSIGTTNADPVGGNVAGVGISSSGNINISKDSNPGLLVNRVTNDGDLVQFYQAGALEGAISVAGNTVTYGPFCGYHWSQLSDGTAPALEVGTVMDSINELCQWDGESEQRLPKAKVSDIVGSPAVYGVFMKWDTDWAATNDMAVASVGAYFCRVAAGTVLAIGDLLESAGNGYAQKQADDIIRTRTIGKVTALTQSHIAADGSFCIPTVLYCG